MSSPAATAYNTTSIWVTFNPPKAAEGKIRGYRLHYTDFRAKKEEGNVETNDPLARKLLVNGLQPNKDYYFSLTAFTRRSSSFPTSYVATKSKAAGMYIQQTTFSNPRTEIYILNKMHLYSKTVVKLV